MTGSHLLSSRSVITKAGDPRNRERAHRYRLRFAQNRVEAKVESILDFLRDFADGALGASVVMAFSGALSYAWLTVRGSAFARRLGGVLRSTGWNRCVIEGDRRGRQWRVEVQSALTAPIAITRLEVDLPEVAPNSGLRRERGFLEIPGGRPLQRLEKELTISGDPDWKLVLADQRTREALTEVLRRYTVIVEGRKLRVSRFVFPLRRESTKATLERLLDLAELVGQTSDQRIDRAIEFIRTGADTDGRAAALDKLIAQGVNDRARSLIVELMDGDSGEPGSAGLFRYAADQGWSERLLRPIWAASASRHALEAYVEAIARFDDPRVEERLLEVMERTPVWGPHRLAAIRALGRAGGPKAIEVLRGAREPAARESIASIKARLELGPGRLSLPQIAPADGELSLARADGALSLEQRAGAVAIVAGGKNQGSS